MMRALTVSEFNKEPAIGEVETPIPGPDQVAISVKACGLNFADLLMMQGTYQETPPLPFTLGLEVAGRVSALGTNVSGLSLGQRVAAYVGAGGLADTVITSPDRVIALPGSMDDVTAAGFLIAYATSHLALKRRARLKPGEKLLVLGAAGGVGRTAVEIGAAMGAHVVGVARGSERLEAVKAAGAHEVIDGKNDGLFTTFRASGPFDVVYDAIGGETGEAAMRALSPEGRHLLIGFASGDLPRIKPNHLLVKNTEVIGFYLGNYLQFAPGVLRDSILELTEWHDAGRISPHVSHELPFEQCLEGLDLLRRRKATGKIVITL